MLFKYKSWIIISFLLAILNTIVQIPLPLITKFIIDEILINKKVHLIWDATIVILLVIPFIILFPFLKQLFLAKLTHKTGIMLRSELCKHFLKIDLSCATSKSAGYFSSIIFQDVDRLIASIYQVLFPILQNAFLFIVGIVLLIYLKWELAVIPILMLPLYALFNFRLGSRLKKENLILHEMKAENIGFFTNLMQAVESTRAHSMENIRLRTFFSKSSGIVRQELNAFFSKIKIESLNNTVMVLIPSLVLIAGIHFIINGKLSLGEYVAFAAFMNYVIAPIRFFFSSNITFQDFRVALERIANIFETPLSHEYIKQPMEFSFSNQSKPLIQFDSVYFSYSKKDILKNITFKINPGERIAIMGESGSGKTTLIKLMLGLYLPTKGVISISGNRNEIINWETMRKQISYIEQEPILFESTIKKNIIQKNSERKNVRIAKVYEATKKANAYGFIKEMEHGHESHIHNFGKNLSVGQKQRIMLSQAFYKNSEIFILDEPTSSLDKESERLIKKSLANIPRDKTVIIVSHSHQLAEIADRIISVEKGKIIDVKTLEKKGATYYETETI
jgi:ABC-type bacteriocin/lantibiotic exporter with double-glycine peptidase domain